MDQALKSRILENKFVDQIRSWIIDLDAFAALCDDLKLLAREWRAVSLIDKELVAHLFLILTVTRNMADGLVGHAAIAWRSDDELFTAEPFTPTAQNAS